MAFLANFGKFLLVLATVSHAALLLVDQEPVAQWNSNVKHIVAYGKTLHPLLVHLDYLLINIDCVRYTVAFFEGFSIFLLLTNCKYVSMFAFFGVALGGFVQYFPQRNNIQEIQQPLLQLASVLGAYIFLMGSFCGSKQQPKKVSSSKKNN